MKSVNIALAALSESELPNEVKDFIASQLLNVKTAIAQYKYRGVRGLQEALAAYCGSIALSAETVDERITPATQSKLKRAIETGNSLVTLSDAGSRYRVGVAIRTRNSKSCGTHLATVVIRLIFAYN